MAPHPRVLGGCRSGGAGPPSRLVLPTRKGPSSYPIASWDISILGQEPSVNRQTRLKIFLLLRTSDYVLDFIAEKEMGPIHHGEHHGSDWRLEDHCQEQ